MFTKKIEVEIICLNEWDWEIVQLKGPRKLIQMFNRKESMIGLLINVNAYHYGD